MDREAAKKALQSEKASGFFKEMYGTGAAENEKRYEHVLEEFGQAFGEKNVSMFTSAGRTEISGNHTDHNNGKVSGREYQSGLRSLCGSKRNRRDPHYQ